MRRRTGVLLLIAALPLAGCAFNPTGPESPSSFTATLKGHTVEGPIEAAYSGTGHFATTSARRPAAPPMFLLHSEGSGDAVHDGFQLSKAGNALPAAGQHALGPGADDYQMIFTQRRGAVIYRYTAQSGALHITRAAADGISGTFQFEGAFVGTCTVFDGGQSCMVAAPAADAPRLEVSGSFDAVPR